MIPNPKVYFNFESGYWFWRKWVAAMPSGGNCIQLRQIPQKGDVVDFGQIRDCPAGMWHLEDKVGTPRLTVRVIEVIHHTYGEVEMTVRCQLPPRKRKR